MAAIFLTPREGSSSRERSFARPAMNALMLCAPSPRPMSRNQMPPPDTRSAARSCGHDSDRRRTILSVRYSNGKSLTREIHLSAFSPRVGSNRGIFGFWFKTLEDKIRAAERGRRKPGQRRQLSAVNNEQNATRSERLNETLNAKC